MARKRISVRSLTKTAMDGVKVYVGIAAGRALVNNIGALQTNPILGVGVQLGAAILLSSGQTAPIALGMAANAAGTAVNTLAPGLASSLGISGLGAAGYGSTQIPGVAGGIGRIGKNYNQPIVKVN